MELNVLSCQNKNWLQIQEAVDCQKFEEVRIRSHMIGSTRVQKQKEQESSESHSVSSALEAKEIKYTSVYSLVLFPNFEDSTY